MPRPDRTTRATYRRRSSLAAAAVVLAVSVIAIGVNVVRSDDTDAPPTTPAARSNAKSTPVTTPRTPTDPYAGMRATGKAKRVLAMARRQMGVEYVYGAQPRDPDGLAAIGRTVHARGFDCSSFVAYAFMAGIGEWMSGTIAHTDQIWTQGGALPLTSTAGETERVQRGMASAPPRGGYRPGDLLLTRAGSGGYWGHVLLISERGLVIQSYPPDVYETDRLSTFLDLPDGEVGWVRVKSLAT